MGGGLLLLALQFVLSHPSCCWTLSQPPHLGAEFPPVQVGRGGCGGEGAGVPGEQLCCADVGTSP